MKLFISTFILLCLSGLSTAETVKFAFSDGYPAPYVIDKDKGIEVEIVKQAFKAVDIEVEVVFLSYKRMRVISSSGIDGYGVTHFVKDDGLYYSNNYISYNNFFYSKESDGIVLSRIADVIPYKIGSWQTAPEDLAGELLEYYGVDGDYSDSFVRKVSDLELAMMFWQGRIDILIQDILVHKYHTKSLENKYEKKLLYKQHDLLDSSKVQFSAAFKTQAHRDAFNGGLKIIQSNGIYNAIYTKYGSE